jgi:hypothetical protein
MSWTDRTSLFLGNNLSRLHISDHKVQAAKDAALSFIGAYSIMHRAQRLLGSTDHFDQRFQLGRLIAKALSLPGNDPERVTGFSIM